MLAMHRQNVDTWAFFFLFIQTSHGVNDKIKDKNYDANKKSQVETLNPRCRKFDITMCFDHIIGDD